MIHTITQTFLKKTFFIFPSILSLNCISQNLANCNIQNSEAIAAPKLDKEALICIAKNSNKPYTVFYTLASWCEPCRMHFPDALDLQKNGKVNLFVILVEAEKDPKIKNAISFIKSKSENVQFGVLNDEKYGIKVGKRNTKLATEITPNGSKVIDDFGKFILVDRSGQILYVTNYKDYDKDWKNSKQMLEKKIIPLLK